MTTHLTYLVIGLGNIGPEYADTRHNIGFMIADELAKQGHASFSNMRLAYYTEFTYTRHQICLIKPTTYMNLSGKAVNYWMRELKIPIENILVVLDDLSLPFGAIRLKPKGSSGGHNGLKDIESLLGNTNYARLRFGIGSNFPKGQQVNYVLSSFDKEERSALPILIDQSIEMIQSFVSVGAELTMTKFNK